LNKLDPDGAKFGFADNVSFRLTKDGKKDLVGEYLDIVSINPIR
jgi:hypothetical protein